MGEAEQQPVVSPRVSDATAADTMDLMRFIAILWRWRTAIVLGSAGAAGLALLMSFAMPKIYESTATLIALAPRFRESPVSGSYDLEEARMAKSYEGIIVSPGALIATIEKFNLDAAPFNLTQEKFADRVSVATTKESNVLRISVELKDRLLAAEVANFMAQRAVDLKRQVSEQSLEYSRAFMRDEVSNAKAALEIVENELEIFQSENATAVLQEEFNVRLARYGALKGEESSSKLELVNATVSRQTLEKEVGKLPRMLKTSRSLIEDPTYQQMLSTRSGVADNAAMAGLSMEVEELNPTFIDLEGRLASERTKESALTAHRLEVTRQLEENLDRLDALRRELVAKDLKVARLQQTAKLAGETYTKLSTALSATNIEVVSKSGQLQIVDPAQPAERHLRPRKSINTIMGGAFGFLVMVVIALLSDYIRGRGGLERFSRGGA